MTAARPSLTARQREVLTFFAAYFRSHQNFPTLREVMEHFRFASPEAVQCHIRPLEKKGYLVVTPGLARGYRIPDLDGPVQRAVTAYLKSLPSPDGSA